MNLSLPTKRELNKTNLRKIVFIGVFLKISNKHSFIYASVNASCVQPPRATAGRYARIVSLGH